MEGHRTGAEETDLRPSLPAKLNRWRHLPTLPQPNKIYPELSTMLGLHEAAHHNNIQHKFRGWTLLCSWTTMCPLTKRNAFLDQRNYFIYVYCINETQISLINLDTCILYCRLQFKKDLGN